ncbi:MAG: Tol-Pal system beta propeller repeat protein TolB, partial [Proteobacteria bacterium]|nr:Tol-Pal system beta propeller repeat protein TolB [Pseudomonadota bacterium]
MNRLPLRFLALCLVLLAPAARADLLIDVTRGVTDAVPIAVVPFARAVPADGGLDVGAVVQHDLDSSGRFKSMERRDMLTQPVRARDVQVADWRAARNDYMVVGRVVATVPNELTIEFELLNLLSGQVLLEQRVTTAPSTLRFAAHRVADLIYERLTGIRGAFSTRIAYVSVDGGAPNQRYQLLLADSDGENLRTILESPQPIMSPSWSADGEWLTYVSFENHASAVYVQRVRTGERRMVSARAGINGAPAFSPDGRKLALTLSGTSGNPDIYVLDLATQGLTRITEDPAIDTEAAWSADGRFLFFTSDRAGGPQVYRVAAQAGEQAKRLTFGVPYAARPRVSADGSQLALMMRDGSGYHIAVQDLSSGQLRVLTRGAQDESPSFAPNGAQIMYASRERGQGVLAA